MRFQLEHGIGAERVAHIIVVISESPDRGKGLQGSAPTGHPRAELPDHGCAQPAIPAVLAEVQRLTAVIIADRESEVDNDMSENSGS